MPSGRHSPAPVRRTLAGGVRAFRGGHILGGVKDETLPRVFEYWKNVDSEIGQKSRRPCAPETGELSSETGGEEITTYTGKSLSDAQHL
jgi:hypothetical protein